jgi:hypothetical protein
MDRGTEFDYAAAVEVRFFEDLTFRDVTPILDSFAETSIFNVRASRDGWSGPAAGGPEIGLIITAISAAGGAAFVASFFSELGKGVYKSVRAAILAAVRKVHDNNRRRAVIGLSIRVRNVSVCFGPLLERQRGEDEWTDDWFVKRLREAQALLDKYDADPSEPSDDRDCRHRLR